MKLRPVLFFTTLMLVLVIGQSSAQETPPLPDRPATIGSSVTIGGEKEPGERLVITGRVYRSDRKTPAAGVLLYLYQTDASGVYNNESGSWQKPRLHGWFRTDEDGRYEIRTIKPGSYPNRRQSAHIHLVIVPENGPARWLDDFLFEGDPFLSSSDRERPDRLGSFSNIMKISKEKGGLLRCGRDIILDSP